MSRISWLCHDKALIMIIECHEEWYLIRGTHKCQIRHLTIIITSTCMSTICPSVYAINEW